MSVAMFVLYDILGLFFFASIDWNNFYCKTFDHRTHLLSQNMRNKHLATFAQNLKIMKKTGFFSNLFCGGIRFFTPTLKITWAWEVDAPVIT